MNRSRSQLAIAAFAAALGSGSLLAEGVAPIVPGSVKVSAYDGVTDDLLSAGLSLAGLQGAAPGFADLDSTPAEWRRRAIYNNSGPGVAACFGVGERCFSSHWFMLAAARAAYKRPYGK